MKAAKEARVPAKAGTLEPPNGGLPAELAPSDMLKQAIASGAGVEVMERLLALQERYEANKARKAFDAAMAAVRSELPAIIKSRTVVYDTAKGRTEYRYEDLHSVVEALSPILAQHGLSFRWRTKTDTPDTVTVTCILAHRDGHTEETELTAKHDHSGSKNDIQAMGSAVTYLQRYTLKAALGVAAGEDDDGQASGPRRDSAGQSEPPPKTESKKYAFTDSHRELKELIAAYIKENDYTPDYEAKILIRLTTWVDKEGVNHPGVGEWDKVTEKMAIWGIKRFKEKVAEAKKKTNAESARQSAARS